MRLHLDVMNRSVCFALLAVSVAILLGPSLAAQRRGGGGGQQVPPSTPSGTPPPASAEETNPLKESLAKNQVALRQYTWIETTEISLKGSEKKEEQKQCYYGADGKVQKTPVPGAAPEQPANSGGGGRGGVLKKKIVANKIDDMKDYMDRVKATIAEYVPPDPERIQAAQAAGHVTVQPAGGTVSKMTITDYAKPGDSLAIGVDTSTMKLASYNVRSYVEKPKEDDVTLAVTYAALPDGTSYPQQTVLDAKAKQITVKVTNSGYKKGS
jgi:hypothetical protein